MPEGLLPIDLLFDIERGDPFFEDDTLDEEYEDVEYDLDD